MPIILPINAEIPWGPARPSALPPRWLQEHSRIREASPGVVKSQLAMDRYLWKKSSSWGRWNILFIGKKPSKVQDFFHPEYQCHSYGHSHPCVPATLIPIWDGLFNMKPNRWAISSRSIWHPFFLQVRLCGMMSHINSTTHHSSDFSAQLASAFLFCPFATYHEKHRCNCARSKLEMPNPPASPGSEFHLSPESPTLGLNFRRSRLTCLPVMWPGSPTIKGESMDHYGPNMLPPGSNSSWLVIPRMQVRCRSQFGVIFRQSKKRPQSAQNTWVISVVSSPRRNVP